MQKANAKIETIDELRKFQGYFKNTNKSYFLMAIF